ncbi:MAG: putative collagen-binding domain-containing protein [Armatimonadota bacterium]|nr:putative collagen-binding domain-containing protein [Armatimonadota bacterium]
MIDETIGYSNVLYEVENEHWEHSDPAWGNHYGQFVKDYIAANYPTTPRLVSYNSLETDLESFYTSSSVDIVNKHYGNEANNNPSVLNDYIESRWGSNKPINIDEFANGVTSYDLLRTQCWTIVSSGGHFHVEDANETARVWDVVENIRSFKALSGWDFIHAYPFKATITSGGGYCMRQTGVEYVCYFPTGGSKTITLNSGTYRAEWWNPRTGGFYNVTTFSHGGAGKTLSAPDSNDWVLHITTQAAPTTILQSKWVGAIAVDGSSGDWNLGAAITKICAGDVGTGDIALAGYDTNMVCYSGGHATGLQYPQANAADHSAKVYSKHNLNYLYFLIRSDDNDIRYSNPTSSNYLNDCVEIYIDPGNDGSPTPIMTGTPDASALNLVRIGLSGQYGMQSIYYDYVYYTTAGAYAPGSEPDMNPPGPVTGFTALGGVGQTTLSWQNPGDSDFAGTMIRYSTSDYPVGPTDGSLAYNGTSTSYVHFGRTNGTRYYYSAFAYDEVPNYSTAANAGAHAAAEATIYEAKCLPNNEVRILKGKAVSAKFGDCFYIQEIQEPGNRIGIKISPLPLASFSVGDNVDVVGVIKGANDERYLDITGNTVKTNLPALGDPGPVGMGAASLGGILLDPLAPGVDAGLGPNNIGLLVRVWGRVTQLQDTNPKYLYIDDGSGLKDGTQTGLIDNVGIRVNMDPSDYDENDYLVITGISGFFNDGGILKRQVTPRAGGIIGPLP